MNDLDDPEMTAALRTVAGSIDPDASFDELTRAIRRDRHRRRAVAIVAGTAAIAVAVIVATALRTTSSRDVVVATDGDVSSSTAAAPGEAAITIDVDDQPHLGGRSNLVVGTLRVDRIRRCLYLEAETGRFHLVFPAGSTVAYEPIRVLEADGSEFARVDEPASFGGSIADPTPVPEGANGCGASQSIYVWRG